MRILTYYLFTICLFFFFSSRRRHTRWPRDWSSDVCSSDLGARLVLDGGAMGVGCLFLLRGHPHMLGHPRKIGRASCRERVKMSVVDVVLIKKKRVRTLSHTE